MPVSLLQYVLSISFLLTTLSSGVDWPMWRNDAGHTAVSRERLPSKLHLQWVLTFEERPRVWDDPLNHDLMSYDKIFEPIVLGDLLYVGFSDQDKVVAFDTDSGEEKWTFFADGPVRFAPVGWQERIYICSDDGYLYCLNASDGSLIWKFRGAPSDRKALGNLRVISAWPARGGPVLREGNIYFAASIWPFMGTFIYALDARTGAVQWVNDGTGADYIKQPHSAPSFAGVAPQGTLVALEDQLLVPGGRSVPAGFDRKTGEQIHFNLDAGGKANGGSFVVGQKDKFFVHTRERGVRAYEVKNGKKTGFLANEPVLADDVLYTSANQPALKTKYEAAEKAMADAAAAQNKADKQLAAAVVAKAKPLAEPRKVRDAAKVALAKAEKTLNELKIQLDPEDPFLKEAESIRSDADKAAKDTQKKLDDAKKRKKDPIDKKLYQNLDKATKAMCDKTIAYESLRSEWETIGRDVRVLQAYDPKGKLTWEFEADATGDLIMSGGVLYAAGETDIVAVTNPGSADDATITWRQSVDGEVLRLLAANGKLYAVMLDGRILCYGQEKVDNPLLPPKRVGAQKHWQFSQSADNKLARQVLALADVDEGYALSFGVDDGRMTEAFAEESQLHFVAVEPDNDVVEGLREKFDYMDLYGKRVVLQKGDPQSYQAPPYIFSLVTLGDAVAEQLHDPSTIKLIYESVRPYGGALWFRNNPALVERLRGLALPGAEITPGPKGSTFVFRQGPLPEAADWTHQYGDMANTVKSDDKRVKLPLGILWFGGSSNSDVLPRHGHGPSEQVVGGRTIIEGMNRLSARDVYTGRVLWKRDFENLGTYGVYYDNTYTDDPLNPAYNQVHIPGANARGTNYIATEDQVYVAIGSACHVLDAESGQDVKIIEMPKVPEAEVAPSWAFIGVEGDLLLAGNDFARYTSRYGLKKKGEKAAAKKKESTSTKRRGRKRKEKKETAIPPIEDLSASRGLIAFDRHSGEMLWKVDAEFSFLHNGIISGGGKFFIMDKFPKSMEDKLKRRGLAKPEDYRILAVDAENGKLLWEKRGDIFGTWLSYSAKHDILLQAGAKARDRLKDEVGEGLTTYRGATGEVIWEKSDLAYAGPCILHNDLILTTPDQYADSSGAFHLTDGSPYLVKNPLTGAMEPWRITRAYGCNTPIAGEHLLTFRSGAAGYYDLDNMGGTGNFGGFKSGCTSNLIPANGVLNAPDYTRTCSCGYQNQTSLALVHMPDVELWTYNRYGADSVTDEAVQRVGINFGAPGDRRASDGTLWLESPDVGGASPEVTVEVIQEKDSEGKDKNPVDYFRRHSSQVDTASGLKWVAASGIANAEKITITPKMRFQPKGSKEKLDIRVARDEDDAEETSEGSVNLTSSDLELNHDEGEQLVGMRFQDLQLFPGEKIKNAYIQFVVDEPNVEKKKDKAKEAEKKKEKETKVEEKLLISFEKVSDASPFTATHRNLSDRELTEKPIEWKPKPWKKKDEKSGDQRTPNLVRLLQSLVDREDWQFGNAVAILIAGEGKRVAHAYDKDGKHAPRLVIELDGDLPRVRVGAKEDDAEESLEGVVSLASSDLELTSDTDKSPDQVIGIRFRALQIPRGQLLEAAYIQFTVKDPSEEPTELTISIEQQPDPPQFKADKEGISARKTLSTIISWAPAPWKKKEASGKAQRTPNLAPLIQEIINRDDWKPGNALSFIVTGKGNRSAFSFDGKKELAPKLLVNYKATAEIEIPLETAPRFTVRLHFFDPAQLPRGQRVFNVALQGKPVLEQFDIASLQASGEQHIMREFTDIPIPHHLDIEFTSASGSTQPPVLSGVELIGE